MGAIEAVWTSGNVRLKSHSGEVTLAECAAHPAQVTTHSGGVTIDNRPASHGGEARHQPQWLPN